MVIEFDKYLQKEKEMKNHLCFFVLTTSLFEKKRKQKKLWSSVLSRCKLFTQFVNFVFSFCGRRAPCPQDIVPFRLKIKQNRSTSYIYVYIEKIENSLDMGAVLQYNKHGYS